MTSQGDVPRLRLLEAVPAAPRQARSLEKRKQLLEAARALFAEDGYDAVSIVAMTTRAGMAAGAFYTYFRSKRQLLVVLMEELLAHLRALNLRPGDARDMKRELRRFLGEVLRSDLRYYGVIRAWQEASIGDRELAGMRVAVERWTIGRIERTLRGLLTHPLARSDRDIPAFARLLDRHFWSLLARGAAMPAREFNREIGLIADVIHHYLFFDNRPL